MGMIPSPLRLEELKRRYDECIAAGIKDPTLKDVDPEFIRWLSGERSHTKCNIIVLIIGSIILLIISIMAIIGRIINEY